VRPGKIIVAIQGVLKAMIKRKAATVVLLVLDLVVMGDEVLTRSTAALQIGATKAESQAKALNPKGQSPPRTVTGVAQNEGGRKSERDRAHRRGGAAVSMIDLKKIDRTIRNQLISASRRVCDDLVSSADCPRRVIRQREDFLTATQMRTGA
jgi:hypothetical protein